MNKKTFRYKKFLGLVFVLSGLYVVVNGFAEFDNATTLISFLRGLVLMIIGGLSVSGGWDKLEND